MKISQTEVLSVMFIFLMVLPFCAVEGRTRLLHSLHEELRDSTRIVPNDHRLSDHSTDPGYSSVRKLLAMEATQAGKSASSENDDTDSVPAAASSGSRRRLPFHTQFVSKFPFFTSAKDSDTVSPSPGTPSPGHNWCINSASSLTPSTPQFENCDHVSILWQNCYQHWGTMLTETRIWGVAKEPGIQLFGQLPTSQGHDLWKSASYVTKQGDPSVSSDCTSERTPKKFDGWQVSDFIDMPFKNEPLSWTKLWAKYKRGGFKLKHRLLNEGRYTDHRPDSDASNGEPLSPVVSWSPYPGLQGS